MAALAEVGREISATLDLSGVLERIAERRTTPARRRHERGLPAPSRTGETFRAIGWRSGEIADSIRADAIMRGEGIIGDIAVDGAAEVVNDPCAGPARGHDRGDRDDESERLMVAPLHRPRQASTA